MNPDFRNPFQNRLEEKLAESLTSTIPIGTTRRVFGEVRLSGKVTAVVGTRRAGKTMFVHQVRRERLAEDMARERLPYINFEDERLTDIGGPLRAFASRSFLTSAGRSSSFSPFRVPHSPGLSKADLLN